MVTKTEKILYKFNEKRVDIVETLLEFSDVESLNLGYEGTRGPIHRNTDTTTTFPTIKELTLTNVQLKEDDFIGVLLQTPHLLHLKLEKCSFFKSQKDQGCLNLQGCTLLSLQVFNCKLYLSKLEKPKKLNKFEVTLDNIDKHSVQLSTRESNTLGVITSTTYNGSFEYTLNISRSSASLQIQLYSLGRFEANPKEYLSIYPEDTEKETDDMLDGFDLPEPTTEDTDSAEDEQEQVAGPTSSIDPRLIIPEREDSVNVVFNPSDRGFGESSSGDDSNDSVTIIRPTINESTKKIKSPTINKSVKRMKAPTKPSQSSESEYENESILSSSSRSSVTTTSSLLDSDSDLSYRRTKSSRARGRPPLKRRRKEASVISSSSENSDMEIQNKYYQQKALIAEVVANCQKYRAVIRVKDNRKRRYWSPSL